MQDDDLESLKKLIASRSISCRSAAKLSSSEASRLIGHKNSTQLSLIESAERLPSFTTLRKMAEVYVVPMDYLAGLTDDPIADFSENNQGLIYHCINNSIANCLTKFSSQLSSYTAMSIVNNSHDRIELMDLCSASKQVIASLERIIEINPESWNEIKGGSRLESLVRALGDQVRVSEKRIVKEKKAKEVIESESQQDIFKNCLSKAEQFVFDFIKFP